MEIPEAIRSEAESMFNASLPLVLRIMSDRDHEVALSITPLVSEMLRVVSTTCTNLPDASIKRHTSAKLYKLHL